MSMLTDGTEGNVVKTQTQGYVWIHTCYTMDYGWETMVFKCDKDGNVEDWWDLDCMRYPNRKAAYDGHMNMVTQWKSK